MEQKISIHQSREENRGYLVNLGHHLKALKGFIKLNLKESYLMLKVLTPEILSIEPK